MQDQRPDNARLYVAVRDDLPPGLQMAQAVHAAFSFAHEHRDLLDPWLLASNFLVIVSVPDENHLLDLISEAHRRGIVHTGVREPDVNDEATAVALAPGVASQRLCASLPLALRQMAMT